MNNYPYIIASLPVLARDGADMPDIAGTLADIRAQLGKRDAALFDFVLDGFDADKLNADFYRRAQQSPNAFIRAYFRCDRGLRNAKTAYLNRQLGRPEGTDILHLEGEEAPWEESAVRPILEGTDILARERGLDAYLWDKAEEMTLMHVFDLDVILGFTVRLKMAARWMGLDPETGRQLFRSLVHEIKNTQKEIWQPKEK
ncbi:MAG: DUF2764 family protein [Bacteroidales bacterium]|nr:DUF2764 family protein [Bacteroidales bacterium]